MEGKIEFAIFCIENLAKHLNMDSVDVYNALTTKSHILNDYIVRNYDILHTQSKEYIMNDIVDVMREAGVCA